MRFAKITRRSQIACAPQFGVENGKVYVDDTYEDGTFRTGSNPLDNNYVQNMDVVTEQSLREAISPLTSPKLEGDSVLRMRYHTISGIDYSDWVSNKGATFGKRYHSRNGMILDENGEVIFKTHDIQGSGNFAHVPDTALRQNMVCRIVHETDSDFVVYAVADDYCSLHRLTKSTGAAARIFFGQFSLHLCGITKGDEEFPEYTLFLVMMNSVLQGGAGTSSWAAEDRPSRFTNSMSSPGAFLLGMVNFGDIWQTTNGLWMHQLKSMNATWYYSGVQITKCNQRFLVDSDSSMVVKDSEGYVTSVSFVGPNSDIVPESSLIHPGSTTPYSLKLNDNLCLFRAELTGDRSFELSYSKLPVTDKYLAAAWDSTGITGSGTTAQLTDVCLIAGKVWTYVRDNQLRVCLLINNRGFEAYCFRDTSSPSYLAGRTKPNLPPTMITIAVDTELRPIEGQVPEITEFEEDWGANIHEISMLVIEDGAKVIIPSQMYVAKGSLTESLVGESSVAVVDVVAKTCDTFKVPESSSAQALASVGIDRDRMFIINGNDNLVMLDKGPSPKLSLTPAPGGHTLNISVDAPSTVRLQATAKVFDGASSVVVEVADATSIPLTHSAGMEFKINVVSCTALEVQDEND